MIDVRAARADPETWRAALARKGAAEIFDEFLQADDRFMWNIDTFNNQLSGYFFEMNPSGLMGDALRGANFQNRQWTASGPAASSAVRWAGRSRSKSPSAR